ncbi:hypothetical protein BDN67DRAFT_988470 [Paxillus ammoniavirescens]|nr:hypothetical protein BDN67DRAFT_988470 [Paxillus ammoniavirescens]
MYGGLGVHRGGAGRRDSCGRCGWGWRTRESCDESARLEVTPNDFVNPNHLLARTYPDITRGAQFSVLKWADLLASEGPWSKWPSRWPFLTLFTQLSHPRLVVLALSKTLSSWPNCSALGNTPGLPLPQVWSDCPYYLQDGVLNPDVRMINNTGHFNAMGDASWMNSSMGPMTWINRYAHDAATFINVWFIHNSTALNLNLVYSQMWRGPGKGQIGAYAGELEQGLDDAMVDRCARFVDWFKSYWIALEEAIAKNVRIANHGFSYYLQLVSHQFVAKDIEGARATIKTYFDTIYVNQITETGKQVPRRTRPYYYRVYNIMAMITNARIGDYTGLDFWDWKGFAGTGIRAALDFAMTIPPGREQAAELYQPFGDEDGKYASFLVSVDAEYPSSPYFL